MALDVYNQYLEETGDNRKVVIASTASPYKFVRSVLEAVDGKVSDNEFENAKLLSEISKTDIPAPIKALENATVRFKEIRQKDDMLSAVYSALEIKN